MPIFGHARRAAFVLLLVLLGPGWQRPAGNGTATTPGSLSVIEQRVESTARTGHAPTRARSLPTTPLRFEANVGQTDARVDAIARGDGYTLYLASGNALFAVHSPSRARRSLGVSLVGAAKRPHATLVAPQPGVTNYLTGSDRSKWRTGVRGYSTVKYTDVYPGIDLLFYGNHGHLEHDFVVAPGADPSVIAFEFDGAEGIQIDDGDLVLEGADIDVRQKRPVIYQDLPHGRRTNVNGRYLVEGPRVRFEVGEYDRSRPLVIDPVTLIYSTYLGGTAAEAAVDVASDGSGSAYILGLTKSLDYPTVNAIQGGHAGGVSSLLPWEPAWFASNVDLVISKLTPDGQAFVFSTYLGGPADDAGFGLAVSSSGEAFIGGSLPGGLPPAPGYEHNCPCDAGFFVAKLNASGSDFTYIARFNGFAGSDLGVDATGHVVVVSGGTAFKLNPEGSALVYNSLIGAGATAVAVAADGTAAVTGFTNSISFPTVAPFQEALHGSFDAFVTRLTTEGAITFSTYLGGLGDDRSRAVAIDGTGSVYVIGTTQSADFPAYNAAQPSPGGNGTEDIFITKISSAGALLFSSYLGGGYPDRGVGVVADARGRVYVLGRSAMGDARETPDADWDLSVTKIDASGAIMHSARLGGPRNDEPAAIALGPDDSVYIAGTTYGGFPLQNPLRHMSLSVITHGGFPPSVDMFLSRVILQMGVTSAVPAVVPAGQSGRIEIMGQEFVGAMRVLVGGQWATDVVVNSTTSMSATVPALSGGFYDIVVMNPDGEQASLPGALMYGRCSFVLPDAPHRFLAAGGTRTIHVTAIAPQCAWNASSNVDWISVQPQDGIGSADVRFTVAANRTNRPRSGVLTIANQAIVIAQSRATDPDVNADGRVDLLWQHQVDGWLAAWLLDAYLQCMDGTLLAPSQVADVNWKVVGAGDFDDDGHLDLVWQHAADGRVAAWLMEGVTLRAGVPFSPAQVVDLDWRIRAVGDLNADGHADLIWQHQVDGRVAVWLMDGLSLDDGRLLNPPAVTDTNWWIVGAGDFNHDGRLDLVWEHQADGRLAIWMMDGPTLLSGQVYARTDTGPSADVKVRAVGDFDGDGHVDLMAQHVDGRDLRFCKNSPVGSGAFVFSCTFAPSPDAVVDTNWRIVGPR